METRLNPAALALLASTPAAFRALAIEFEAATATPAGAWGVKECLAHVLDVCDVCFGRIQRIIQEDAPFIRSIDPSARLQDGGFMARPMEALLEEFEERRARDVAWLRALPAAAFARTGTHDEAGTLSAADIANYWSFHDLTHLRQAAGALQDQLVEHMGNARLFIEEG